MENDTKSKVHDAELIESHEEQMNEHTEELKKGTREFRNLHKKVDNIQNVLGQKAIHNGYTKEQLNKLERTDETMMEIVTDIREKIGEIRGKVEGKEVATDQVTRDKQYEYQQLYNFSNNRFNNTWTFIGGSGLVTVAASLLNPDYTKIFIEFFIFLTIILLIIEYGPLIIQKLWRKRSLK